MRLFIAINFTDEIKNEIFQIGLNLKKQSERGNFSRKENLHVTLAFLGEIAQNQTNTIVDAMETAAGNPFTIVISDFGKFKNRGESLFWCGVKATQELSILQNKIVEGLKKANITVDDKPFKPHITIGRRCWMKQHFSEEEFEKSIKPITMQVTKISLMKSEQIKGTLIYTEIAHVMLQ
jgi:2'-5' RNA ligase